VRGQRQPRTLSTPGKHWIPIAQEAGWATGPVWTGAENLAPTGIRSPARPAHIQSLYQLSYSPHIFVPLVIKISRSLNFRGILCTFTLQTAQYHGNFGNILLRGGANKFLARVNSRCHRAESIVSLERGAYSYAKLQVFSCYRG
jgi:hypothetical protein